MENVREQGLEERVVLQLRLNLINEIERDPTVEGEYADSNFSPAKTGARVLTV